MRFTHHSPAHWLAVAIVLVVGLFTIPHARGQNSAAVGARSDVTVVSRGDGVKRDARTPTQKVKKAVKRTLQRSRTGVGQIDAAGSPGAGTAQ